MGLFKKGGKKPRAPSVAKGLQRKPHFSVIQPTRLPTLIQFLQVPPAGFEPATGALEVRCSIQLSYEGVFSRAKRSMEVTAMQMRVSADLRSGGVNDEDEVRATAHLARQRNQEHPRALARGVGRSIATPTSTLI